MRHLAKVVLVFDVARGLTTSRHDVGVWNLAVPFVVAPKAYCVKFDSLIRTRGVALFYYPFSSKVPLRSPAAYYRSLAVKTKTQVGGNGSILGLLHTYRNMIEIVHNMVI